MDGKVNPEFLVTDLEREILRQEEDILGFFSQKIREHFEGKKHHWRLPV
jgi:hypothetical protein